MLRWEIFAILGNSLKKEKENSLIFFFFPSAKVKFSLTCEPEERGALWDV